MSFQIGDEVYWDSSRRAKKIPLEKLTKRLIDDFLEGTIKFLSEDEAAIINDNDRVYSVKLENVYLAKDIELRNESLQEEFDKLQKEVTEQLNSGIELILKAQSKLNDAGYDIIDDYDLSRPIRGMIDELGWSSSSLSC